MSEWTGLDWTGYPLDCYDYQSTCGAKKTTTAIAAVSANLKDEKGGEYLQNCAQDKGRGGSRGGGNRNQGGDGDMVRQNTESIGKLQ